MALARRLNFLAATRVFVATQAVDLRGGFNRLFALSQTVLQQDPLYGPGQPPSFSPLMRLTSVVIDQAGNV